MARSVVGVAASSAVKLSTSAYSAWKSRKASYKGMGQLKYSS